MHFRHLFPTLAVVGASSAYVVGRSASVSSSSSTATATNTGSATATASASCQDQYNACRSVTDPNNPPNYAQCAAVFASCQSTCEATFDICVTAPDANLAYCGSQEGTCLGYNPFAGAGSSSTNSTSGGISTGPSGLDSTIIAVNAGLNKLINDIVRSDSASAQNDYNALNVDLETIQSITITQGCSNPAAGDALTQNEAIQIIQTIQLTLNEVSLDVTNGNGPAANAETCALIADFCK